MQRSASTALREAENECSVAAQATGSKATGRPRDVEVDEMPEENPSQGSHRAQAFRQLNHGAQLLRQGKAHEAVPYLEQAHQLSGDSVPVLLTLGGAYIMTGRHKEAIPLLERAQEMEPDNAMVWINLGAAYLGNPNLATSEQQMQAIEAFQRALELNPAAPSVHYNLGLIFADRDEIDLAIAAFRQALQVNPLDDDARLWLRKLGTDKGA
jgi:tetratricopeptide (TPR) repeat protein